MAPRVNQDMIDLYRKGRIDPEDCGECGQDNWQAGYDNGADPDYVGFQCRGCGHITGITRWVDEDEYGDKDIRYETSG